MASDPTGSAPIPPPEPPASTSPRPLGGAHASLIERAKNILLQPASEWTVIDGEAATIGGLITGYAAPLAVIPALVSLLFFLVSAGSYISMLGGVLIKMLIIVYAISLGTVVLLGFIIDALAPSLGGVKNPVQAMKTAVYSGTAFWVGGIALIVSHWLWAVVGIGYGGYLLWLGLPKLMRVPVDKAPAYVGATIAIWVVLFFVLFQLVLRLAFGAFGGALMGGLM
jgi:hypothetical protein